MKKAITVFEYTAPNGSDFDYLIVEADGYGVESIQESLEQLVDDLDHDETLTFTVKLREMPEEDFKALLKRSDEEY